MNYPTFPNYSQEWKRATQPWTPNPFIIIIAVLIIVMAIVAWANAKKTDMETDKYFKKYGEISR